MPSHSLSNHQPQRFPSRSLLGNYRGLPPLPMIEEEKDLFNHYYGCCCGTMLRARWVAGIVLAFMVIVTIRFQNDGGIRVLVEGQTSIMAANTAVTADSVKSNNMDSSMDDPDGASPPSSISSFLGASSASSKARSSTLSSIFAMAKSSVKQNAVQDYIRWGFPVRVQEHGRIPLELGHVRDDSLLQQGSHSSSIPLLFHIPRSGGSTVRDILGHCYGYTQASDYGGLAPTAEQQQVDTDHSSGAAGESQSSQFLRIVTGQQLKQKRIQVIEGTKGETAFNNPPFVNVDMTTPAGIWRANQQQFHPEEMADFVYTSHLHPTLSLFSSGEDQQPPRAQARMFTLMRHPMDRTVSMFYYLGSTADEQHLSSVSLEMYARSNRLEHNWMVRFLTNELVQDLTLDHLEMAKRILKEHCLVGFLDQMEESMDRFESYYFPKTHNNDGAQSEPSPQKECRDRFINWGWNNRQSYPAVQEHTTAYELLYRKNEYDILLYEYAQQELWYEQGMLVQQKIKDQHQQTASLNSATIHKNKKKTMKVKQ